MQQKLKENAWQPVSVGGSGGKSNAYTISSYAVSTGWYSQHIDNTGSRRQRLLRYDEMDKDTVEVSKALDILAEDISSSNADDEEIFNLEFDENQKYLKSTIKLLNSAKELWAERTKMDRDFFVRIRNTLKYGISFYLKNPDGTLKVLYPERMIGYILDDADEERVTHYIYDPSIQRIEERNRSTVSKASSTNPNSQQNYVTYSVNDLVILKVGDGPFGKSVLESVFKSWRQMTMLEDAIIIYRVTRASERRVFYVDVGNLQGPKREQAIERQRLRLMQKQSAKKGMVATDYDPHSMTEDIFVPTNSQGKGSRVETLPGGQGTGEITDLRWFAQKVAAGLRIPLSMIDVHTEQGQQTPYNDMRIGQLYQEELRYLGYVKRLQRHFVFSLRENYVDFCRAREILVPDGAMLVINSPNSFADYKEVELNQARLNVAGSTLGFPNISKKFVLQKYVGLDEEELIKNEIEKLKEFGLSDETISEMPEEDINNIVYAQTPRPDILEKYGLAPQEPGIGGF